MTTILVSNNTKINTEDFVNEDAFTISEGSFFVNQEPEIEELASNSAFEFWNDPRENIYEV